ncbi:MAG: response regulator [Leptolyngbyaceae cyanobacterium]
MTVPGDLDPQMFLPTLLNNVECQPIAREVASSIDELLERFLSCNRNQFSGRLTLKLPNKAWSLYFLSGLLVGGTSKPHAIRRWYRQTARQCSQLGPHLPNQPLDASQFWDYPAIAKRVEQGQLARSQMIGIVRGNLDEILFDLIQTYQSSDPTLGIQLSYEDFCEKVTLTPPVLLAPSQVLRQAIQSWNAWSQAGLGKCSPNLVPVIKDSEALRQQTPTAAYNNLTQYLNGHLTLRDLAIALKQHLVLLTRSLMPYVAQDIIGLQTVPDLVYAPRLELVPQPARPQPTGPCIAYLEDSRFDSMAMGKILEDAGYQFVGIREPIQALPMLLEHKPELIFLDVLMPVLNGYEVCAQIRQISLFKKTPVIIVTSSDGIVDRVRAKLVGSSDFLAKPITSDKVLTALQKHLPVSSPPSSVPPSDPTFTPTSRSQPRNSNLSPETLAWRRNFI